MVTLARDHLWRRIAGRATRRLQGLASLVPVREAKVDDLNAFISGQKQVLRLQVTMHYRQLVQVFNARDYLVEEATCLSLLHAMVGDNVVEDFAARGILHD